jgi:hypothetical protein
LIALGLGIKTMLQAPTLILAPQFLVLLCTPILIVVSLAVGFGLKLGLKSSWHTLTFTATLETLVCGIFYFSLHRSNEQIEIPVGYKGQVYLMLSDEQENDFQINENGIGYLKEQSMNKGFVPVVIQRELDITNQISGYGHGSGTFNNDGESVSVDFVSFEVPDEPERWKSSSISDLMKRGAIDISRIQVK